MTAPLFSVDELMAAARRQAGFGLQDFGPPDFLEGFSALVDSLNRENVITENHIGDVRDYFLRLLTNRLWFAKDLAEHPEILDEDIGSLVIITSPPRTGSTKLQRLLGASGAFQVVPLWKAHRFARIPGRPDGGVAERIAATEKYEKWMYATSPKILTSHPEFTHEPAEDNLLCEFSFRHTHIFGLFDAPSFNRWIMAADPQPMYDYFHMQLQYLQWQFKPAQTQNEPTKPWLLKSPCHFGIEHHLCRAFNSPRFLATHRDPVEWMPSVTPTAVAYRKLYCDRDSTPSFSVDGTEFFARSAFDHMAWRDANPQVPVLDIPFEGVNSAGLKTAEDIFRFLGIPFTDDNRHAIAAWEQENQRNKHGKHEYSAEAMGTDDATIRRIFMPYSDRFGGYFRNS